MCVRTCVSAVPLRHVRRLQIGVASGVAPATVFLSHAWAYRFADLLAAVRTLADSDAKAHDTYVWNGMHLCVLRDQA